MKQEKIKELRAKKKMSIRKLAELSGVSASAISKAERNLASVSAKSLASLAKSLGVKPSVFFD